MSTWVIGDIHGCLSELQDLIRQIQVQPTDHLIFSGDLVDRGPDSPGVVRFVRKLPCRVTLVQGNHENKHLRLFRGNPVKDPTGELRQIQSQFTAPDVRFLQESVLAWTGVVEGNTYTVVHAGIPPRLRALPLGHLSAKEQKDFRWLTMIRYVTPGGDPVSLGAETPEDRFWADVYDGRFGTVLYGHQPHCGQEDPVRTAHTIGIDLGCVFGGRLAAVRLEDQHVITVTANERYALEYTHE